MEVLMRYEKLTVAHCVLVALLAAAALNLYQFQFGVQDYASTFVPTIAVLIISLLNYVLARILPIGRKSAGNRPKQPHSLKPQH
jgi:hypothetical protein